MSLVLPEYYKTEYLNSKQTVFSRCMDLLNIVARRSATLSFLRVCINLTNSSNEICEFLNKDLSLSTLLAKTITSNPKHYSDADHSPASKSTNPAIAKEDHEKAESRFELLLLSLGLMINFVQESDLVKDLILSHPLADDIKTIFETLITGDVFPSILCCC